MNRQIPVHRGVPSFPGRRMLPAAFLAATILVPALLAVWGSSPSAVAGEKPAATSKPTSKPAAGEVTLKGEYTFGRRTGSFTAKLKAVDEGTYSVVYDVAPGGKPSVYKGTIKSDPLGEIRGFGTSGATFEFSGKFVNGVAKCPYKESGGRGRSGFITLTRQG
jgi:hypothetical protein